MFRTIVYFFSRPRILASPFELYPLGSNYSPHSICVKEYIIQTSFNIYIGILRTKIK